MQGEIKANASVTTTIAASDDTPAYNLTASAQVSFYVTYRPPTFSMVCFLYGWTLNQRRPVLIHIYRGTSLIRNTHPHRITIDP